jgi:penicillin-binding protein 2
MELLRTPHEASEFRLRLVIAICVLTLVFGTLVARLWMLQVVRGEYYARCAAQNGFKEREIPAPRGLIFDAGGHRLADVRAAYDVVIMPADVLASGATAEIDGDDGIRLPSRVSIDTIARALSPLLSLPQEEIVTRYEEAGGRRRYRPLVIKGDVSFEELAEVKLRQPFLPGVDIRVTTLRNYPFGGMFCHVIGYMREVRGDQLDTLRERYADTPFGSDYYEMGDHFGNWGLEAAFEEHLKGNDGKYFALVDVHGRELGRSTVEDPGDEYLQALYHWAEEERRHELPGHDLHLSLRLDLQQLALELMEEESGAVAMMEVHTGRVLALVNAPTFDPQIFASRISPEQWKALTDDPAHPLADKALQGIYPPGSTYKMITGAAALEYGGLGADTAVSCNGYYKLGGHRFRCWRYRYGGHGAVAFKDALKGSCDVYFYTAGIRAGIDQVARMARSFGLDAATGIGVNSEKHGLIPTEAWKLETGRGKWQKGDTPSAVIGQGYTSATPMGLCRMTATIANGGTVFRPTLVDRVVAPDGRVVSQTHPEVVGQADASPWVIHTLQQSMRAVVEEKGGTGHRQQIKGFPIAGKTGTAQVVRQAKGGFAYHKNKLLQDHAWFVAYAPADEPQVAIAVLVEHGVHGSTAAAPIARQLIESYFAADIERIRAAAEEASKAADAAAAAGEGEG